MTFSGPKILNHAVFIEGIDMFDIIYSCLESKHLRSLHVNS